MTISNQEKPADPVRKHEQGIQERGIDLVGFHKFAQMPGLASPPSTGTHICFGMPSKFMSPQLLRRQIQSVLLAC